MDPVKCLSALADAIDVQNSIFWETRGTRPVLGNASISGFQLHKRINYRNGFQTFVYGRISPSAAGSMVFIRFRANRIALCFSILFSVWFGFVWYFSGSKGGLSFVPLLMIVFPWAVFGFGRFLARSERDFLENFLRTTLNAPSPHPEP